jgi:hypothetical protein
MMHWLVGIIVVAVVAAWVLVGMAGWLIVGPRWLAKRVVNRCSNVGRPIGDR